MDALAPFSPKTRSWFEGTFAEATPAQALGWPAIATGEHTLIQAPPGSGKTLAAFLYGIDKLNPAPGEGLRLLYVSPLKALNYDIERNLRGPLAEVALDVVVERLEQEERLGSRDQDVRRLAQHRSALLLGRVAGADAHAQLRPQAGERPAEVALDVVVERL